VLGSNDELNAVGNCANRLATARIITRKYTNRLTLAKDIFTQAKSRKFKISAGFHRLYLVIARAGPQRVLTKQME
jgi:hypothetical protein